MRVIVVGAGLAGLTTAYYLQRDGAAVTVLERAPAVGLGTSFANGAMLHPSICAPWNAPGVLWQVLRWLGREDAPLLLRARALPGLFPWGAQFLRHSSPQRYAANARRNLRLAIYSLELMARIRAETPLSYGYQGRGLLSVFRSSGGAGAAPARCRGTGGLRPAAAHPGPRGTAVARADACAHRR